MNVTTLVLCLFGPLGGLIHRYLHRYKTLMVLGAVLKLIGNCILMTADVRSTQSTGALVMSQVLLGCGAFTVIGARVGSQASVPHEDLSSAIAIFSLWSTLASSVGYTIAASIWTDKMLPFMREELPDVPEKTIKTIYGSIKTLRTKYNWEDPIRQGAVRAYTRVNGVIFITAIVLNILPVVFSLCMPGKSPDLVTTSLLSFLRLLPWKATECCYEYWRRRTTSQNHREGRERAEAWCVREDSNALQERNLDIHLDGLGYLGKALRWCHGCAELRVVTSHKKFHMFTAAVFKAPQENHNLILSTYCRVSSRICVSANFPVTGFWINPSKDPHS